MCDMSHALRHRTILLAAVLALLMLFAQPGPGIVHGQAAGDGDLVNVLVTVESPFSTSDRGAVTSLGGSVRHVFESSPTVALAVPASAVGQLASRNPNFRDVRLDPTVTAHEDTVPWGLGRIGADVVWGGSAGAVSVAPGRPAGAGILVAVIDTGIDKTHPDLQANLVGGRNYVRACAFCAPVAANWNDDNGHGSHVAGTIGALDNGSGVIGVAPDLNLYAIKVLNSQGNGSLSDVVAGIDHAVAVGARVINLSLGSGANDPALKAAVDRAAAAGILVVASAGNSGAGADTVGYPAKYESAFAVAATCGPTVTSYCTTLDARASFSSTGPSVDIAAPGDAVYSTYRSGGYATLSGTSMAAPHVAGAAALILSCNPSLNGAAVRAAMVGTVLDLGPAGVDNSFGAGLLNADAANIAAGCGGPIVDTTPPQTTITGAPANPTNSTTATFNFTSSEGGSTFECSIDAGAFAACSTGVSYPGLSEAAHSFAVRATDAAGNTDPTPATHAWTIDTTPPDTTITGQPTDPSPTNVSFSFASEPGATFACSLDGGAYAACSSPKAYNGLSGGAHTFRVRASDAAGNADGSPATYTWTVQAPVVPPVHVGDLDGSRSSFFGRWWAASVTVTVHNASHQPLAGVVVSASWSGAAVASVQGTTDANGRVTFVRSNLSTSSGAGASITLSVTNLSRAGYSYAPGSNHDPESDSNGTSITVFR
jgi:subtilisin family serine protease